MKRSIILLVALSIISGCSTTINKSQPSSGLNVTGVTTKELKADVVVNMSKKLTGTASKTKYFGITTSGPSHYSDGVVFMGGSSGGFLAGLFGDDDVKAAAAYKAMNKSGADLLVAPQYIISKESFLFFYSKVSVKVTGYPGVIRKIH